MANFFLGFPVPKAKIAEMIEQAAPPITHGSWHKPNGSDPIVAPTDISSDQAVGWDGNKFKGYNLPSGVGVPTGAIIPYGTLTPPEGFLRCNGEAVSRTVYAALFAIIGTSFGVGDGSTTFNVPDLRQRFPLGKADSGTGSTLGGTEGAIDHTHFISDHQHALEVGTGLVAGEDFATTTTAEGAQYTTTNNPPFQVVNYIIKT